MIRDPETDVFTINVKLKTGEFFTDKDIPNNPNGDQERMISFWHEDKLRVYPLENVEYYELVPEKK